MNAAPSPAEVPRRIAWAFDVLAAAGATSVLEVGCGSGVLVLSLARLETMRRIVGVDRSAKAIATARRRADTVDARARARIEWRCCPFAEMALRGRFEALVAVNVNLFWLAGGAQRELQVAQRLLAPSGRLHLFYDAPSAAQAARIGAALPRALRAAGYAVEALARPRGAPDSMVGIVASPVAQRAARDSGVGSGNGGRASGATPASRSAARKPARS